MKYMLDTNICIYTIKHKPEAAVKNFIKHGAELEREIRLIMQ